MSIKSDIEFFELNPARAYRLRFAFPEEISALDPPPDPELWIYVARCRYLPGVMTVFMTDASPKLGELDSESAAMELFQGMVECGMEH